MTCKFEQAYQIRRGWGSQVKILEAKKGVSHHQLEPSVKPLLILFNNGWCVKNVPAGAAYWRLSAKGVADCADSKVVVAAVSLDELISPADLAFSNFWSKKSLSSDGEDCRHQGLVN